jgi:flagellar basal body-associated protein FliL
MKLRKRSYLILAVIAIFALAGAAVAITSSVGSASGPGQIDDEVQEPSYTGSILVDDSQYEGMSEAEEAAALQKLVTISAANAEAAALAANPGTTVVQVELDNENGVVVYSVELSNGLEVKVDAGNGQILHTEQADADEEADDQDNVKEEHESQADDATEAAHAEDD